jgi:hypothetical protein
MKKDGVAGSADGVLREPQAPHALVADLLGLLASQVSDLRGGVEEDTRTINFFLPTCKCSVVSAQVLSAAYSGDTVIQVRVPGEGCDAADESGLKEKIELMGDVCRRSALQKASKWRCRQSRRWRSWRPGRLDSRLLGYHGLAYRVCKPICCIS